MSGFKLSELCWLKYKFYYKNSCNKIINLDFYAV